MTSAYHTEILEQHGERYRIEHFRDYDMGPPWEELEGHGVVTDWTTRGKRPSELVLNSDGRGRYRYYDFAASVRVAKRDNWGCREDSQGMTRKQIAAHAVQEDYRRLRAWCEDDWHWVGVVVTLLHGCECGLHDADTPTKISESLWGIESDMLDKSAVYDDLIGNIQTFLAHYQKAA